MIKTKLGRQILNLSYQAELGESTRVDAFGAPLFLSIQQSDLGLKIDAEADEISLVLGWNDEPALLDHISAQCSKGPETYNGTILLERVLLGVVSGTPMFQIEVTVYLQTDSPPKLEEIKWDLSAAHKEDSSHLAELAEASSIQLQKRTETDMGPVMDSGAVFLDLQGVVTIQIETIKIGFLASENFSFGEGSARFVECRYEEEGELDFLGIEILSIPKHPRNFFFEDVFYIEGSDDDKAQGILVQALITEASTEKLKIDYVIIWETEESDVRPK